MKWPSLEFEQVDPRDPREVLKYRAQRLIQFLDNPATPIVLIAEEVYLIFKAGMECCGNDLFSRLKKWIDEEPSSRELSLCSHCPSFKRDKYGKCSQCTKGDQLAH